ncbi:unknown protein [Seminavis robusta]|uniref:Uncharacterized protein n=1 Tax=Seminavis robusta TaxID=568900 RepID=A0A9N8F3S5_9STRA|nr:unknown protein [Seminavis robusta]|eukprot:Sro3616_g349730.1 n/a (388) ;mRNA; f:777-2140
MTAQLSSEQIRTLITETVTAALQAQLQATAQAQAQQGQQQQQGQQPATAPTFSMAPGGGDQTKAWDFASDKGMKFYSQATKASDIKYDGSSEKLHQFLNFIKVRASTFGMMIVLDKVAVDNNKTRSVITEYGSISHEQMKTHAETYQAEDNRKRQASGMLVTLISNSVLPDVFDELMQREDKYTVKVTPTGTTNAVAREDGAMMLYQLIAMEEQYEDGTVTGLEHPELNGLAAEKYKVISSKKEWKKKSKQELEFIAMKAELEQHKKKQLTQQPISDARKGQSREGRQGGPINTGEWAWKSIAPKEGEATEKKFKGKKYIYCPHHGETKWVLKVNRQGLVHATSCKARKEKETAAASLTATTDTDQQYADALSSVIEDENINKPVQQ